MSEQTTDLPKLRRADCGHGYLPEDAPASGVDHERGDRVYLCAACRKSLSNHIEMKGEG